MVKLPMFFPLWLSHTHTKQQSHTTNAFCHYLDLFSLVEITNSLLPQVFNDRMCTSNVGGCHNVVRMMTHNRNKYGSNRNNWDQTTVGLGSIKCSIQNFLHFKSRDSLKTVNNKILNHWKLVLLKSIISCVCMFQVSD